MMHDIGCFANMKHCCRLKYCFLCIFCIHGWLNPRKGQMNILVVAFLGMHLKEFKLWIRTTVQNLWQHEQILTCRFILFILPSQHLNSRLPLTKLIKSDGLSVATKAHLWKHRQPLFVSQSNGGRSYKEWHLKLIIVNGQVYRLLYICIIWKGLMIKR